MKHCYITMAFTVDDAVVGTTSGTNFPEIPKSVSGLANRFLNHQESILSGSGMFFSAGK